MAGLSRKAGIALLAVAFVALGSAVCGCASIGAESIVGVWHTQLTGYNTVAAGITQYDQNVEFADDGTVRMVNTLPGEVNDVSGRYEVTKIDGKPAIKIIWDVPVDRPTLLYFKLQNGNLLTSPAPDSLDVSRELNVGNQDPVVYVPIKKLSN